MTETVLALDIATATGWACNVGNPAFGTFSTADDPDWAARFDMFENWIDAMILEKRPDVLLIERPFARAGQNELLLQGLCAHAVKVAWRHGIERRFVSPMTIKKWATGSGKAKKRDMIEAARRMGADPANDHEADAICLLSYWLEESA